MYYLLIRLMFIAAAIELGVSAFHIAEFLSQKKIQQIEKSQRDILKINWRPISVFPEEQKRFKDGL